MTDTNNPLSVFMEKAAPIFEEIGLLVDATKVPGTPARAGLGASQTQLLVDATRASGPSGIVYAVTEQLINGAVTLSGVYDCYLKDLYTETEARMEAISLATRLVTQLRVAEHNFALTAGTDHSITTNDHLAHARHLVTMNAGIQKQAMVLALRARTDEERDAAFKPFDQVTDPLSYGDIAVIIRYDILPGLFEAVEALREAMPELVLAHREKAKTEYAEMLVRWPELADRFRGTGNPFFDAAEGGERAELQVATWYINGAYRYTPIKPAVWQAAHKADQIAAARSRSPGL